MFDAQLELLEKSYALASLESERGYLHFLDHVVVDSQPRKKPFRTIAERWQWDRSFRCAPSLDHLAGITPAYQGPLAFWNGYHKGSDKTHDIAREICWLLGWAKRRLNLYVCAGGEDQAALVTAAMRGICLDNPWIAERVTVTDLTAKGVSGGELTILSMNAYGSQGVFPDYLVAEEVTHWKYEEGRQFYDFVLSSINKRPSCVFKVCTNAGHIGSWQWEERNRVEKSKYWSFYEAPQGKPLPSWMNQEKIDDDSQGMEPGERDRLYRNRWVDPGEEHGFLTMEECERCCDPRLVEQVKGDKHIQYFVVMDYGGVHDRCALGIMHVVPGHEDEVVVDRLDCWQGTHQDRIAINHDETDPARRSVQQWFKIVLRNFNVVALVVDPSQLEGLAILYERRLRVERFEWRGGKNNHRMAQLLKHSVQNRKITWSPEAGRLPKTVKIGERIKRIEDDTLSRELSLLITKPMSYGYRFDHEAGRNDDRACCLGMGLVFALPEGTPASPSGPTIVDGTEPFTPFGAPRHPATDGRDRAAHWDLMGMGANQRGSKWDRGDLS